MNEKYVICPYCHNPAPLVSGLQVYPSLRHLWSAKFYKCTPCSAWVGCHPAAAPNGRGGQGDGTVPLGQLANGSLRAARQAAHAAFDVLWKARQMRRRDAYAWLAGQLGIRVRDCHIGHFDEAQCDRTVQAVLQMQRNQVQQLHEQNERTPHAQ